MMDKLPYTGRLDSTLTTKLATASQSLALRVEEVVLFLVRIHVPRLAHHAISCHHASTS